MWSEDHCYSCSANFSCVALEDQGEESRISKETFREIQIQIFVRFTQSFENINKVIQMLTTQIQWLERPPRDNRVFMYVVLEEEANTMTEVEEGWVQPI